MSSFKPNPEGMTQNTPRALVASPYGFNNETTAQEAVSRFAEHIAGKTILITGVAQGSLGGETAVALAAALPARIIISARSALRIVSVASQITSSHPSVKVTILEMDLGSLASVRSAARGVEGPIDVVICNAGVMATPFGKTEDGFEMQFGVCHLGHFVFVGELLKAGKVKVGGRIVTVSSDGHRLGDVNWDDTTYENGAKYNPWEAYGQAKTANILFSIELARRLKERNILSFSLHPGVIFETSLSRHMGEGGIEGLMAQDAKVGYPGWEFKKKSLAQGCATHVVAAFDPSIAKYNGSYLEDCTIFKPLQPWVNPEAAKKLWTLSEELVGEKFEV